MMTLDTFVNLSVVLTGFDKETIQPSHDTLQLSEQYYKVVIERVDVDTLQQLSQTFTSLLNDKQQVDPAQFKTEILDNPSIGPVAKNILKMWYLAIWYYLPNETAPKNPTGDDTGYIVSDKAYTHGLVWRAMQAHPMGYSEDNFGYWSEAPTPIPVPQSTDYSSNS